MIIDKAYDGNETQQLVLALEMVIKIPYFRLWGTRPRLVVVVCCLGKTLFLAIKKGNALLSYNEE